MDTCSVILTCAVNPYSSMTILVVLLYINIVETNHKKTVLLYFTTSLQSLVMKQFRNVQLTSVQDLGESTDGYCTQ